MPRTGHSRPDPADPAYAELKARIITRTGHHYYADKDDLLVERLRRRFRATSVPDCTGYGTLLADGQRGEAEWANLEAEITVGETFFFRYAEQFQALRETILPGLIAAREPERTLRIWSAGCSTGAEAYSLAILVREALGEALPDWRVNILGTDISGEALATARAAEYGRWALRTMPPEERLRYFTRLPPAPGIHREGGYALRPEFRALVRFERGNLLRLAEPMPLQGEGFDLILCRNVLIYFNAETVSGVVRGLGRRLRKDGWLLLGHAEPSPAFSAFLDPVSLPGTVAYRRLEDAVPPPAPWPVLSAASRAMPEPDPVRRTRAGDESWEVQGSVGPVAALAPHLAPAASAAFARPGAAGDDTQAADEAQAGDLDRIRALADAGETGAAWRALHTALDRDPTVPALRFYEGLLARSLGRDAEAERALRAALYLDRGFVMAHYHLGLLLVALGRPEEAARALDNAVALSQALRPDMTLPEGDGAAAGEIAAGAAAARAGLVASRRTGTGSRSS
ncbi:protein-glutamate O-methyltransferase CheR [Methylobacterium sp. NEAU K]|uniref:CheR family methyltransferase n=1 Tax=Methylobacterium sp. NEAU K TaxID=3064946 RepID=UPI002736DD40|nr:protein-glutamate O-methyltransferase CheR [Methylobacterium sp. NEAU K]MDP4004875.1 protein-glutamate O-methyltransferase CheR [Methylobacterium sp. NEAU K]